MPLLEFGLACSTFFVFQLLSGKAPLGGGSWRGTNLFRNGEAPSDRDSDPARLWCPRADWQSFSIAYVLKLLHGELPPFMSRVRLRVRSRRNLFAGGWGAHRDAGDTRARERRAMGSRAARAHRGLRLQTEWREKRVEIPPSSLLYKEQLFETVAGSSNVNCSVFGIFDLSG